MTCKRGCMRRFYPLTMPSRFDAVVIGAGPAAPLGLLLDTVAQFPTYREAYLSATAALGLDPSSGALLAPRRERRSGAAASSA